MTSDFALELQRFAHAHLKGHSVTMKPAVEVWIGGRDGVNVLSTGLHLVQREVAIFGFVFDV